MYLGGEIMENMGIKPPPFALTEDQIYKLVKLAQEGNQTALEQIIREFQGLVKFRARSYFLIGADKDDIIQEGMIGLFKAIRDYDKTRQIMFKTFAQICIERQIISAVKSASRLKHGPLNSYISFNQNAFESQGEKTLDKYLYTQLVLDPESLFIQKEDDFFVELKIDKILTKLEKNVLKCYLEGKSYLEISKELAKTPKSVGNAISRVKKKLESYLIKA
jgi:RNA polymerase sporulation-specific sigma factor